DRIAGPDAGEQIVVLDLIRIAVFGAVAPRFAAAGSDLRTADVGCPVRSLNMFRDAAPAGVGMAALAEHACALSVFEFGEMVVEDFADLLPDPHLPAPLSLGADGVGPFQPVDDIHIVDVLLDDVIAREPVEVVPVPDLVFHFGHAALAVAGPH